MEKNWKSISLIDVKGMATNPVNPGQSYAKRLLNVSPTIKPGALTLRDGYDVKYNLPSDISITESSSINFGVFFDRQAVEDGQEIVCEIQKGIITALTSEGSPIVADTMEGFWFWTRPTWNGTSWEDTWDWINKTIITKITAIDGTVPTPITSHITIFGNATHGLGDDSLIGWTIYNKTKNQFAKVITCKLTEPPLDPTDLSLNITLYNNGWAINDVIICSRCWIDIDAQTEFYNNVERDDIVFHRINNDLRIGFGGRANRPGLMVGYRKTYLQLNKIDFTPLHGDIDAAAIEKFAKIDGIIVDTHILDTTEQFYGIILTEDTGTLEAKTYYFKLTGLIDNYEEQLIAGTNITVDGTKDIFIQPYILLGKHDNRVTRLNLYYSLDNITFYKIREDNISSLKEPTQSQLIVDTNGRLVTESLSFEGNGDYHRDPNAANLTSETNSIGQWVNTGYVSQFADSLSSVTVFTHPVIGSITPADGTYFLYWQNPASNVQQMSIQSPPITTSRKLLTISFKIVARYITIRVSSTGVGFPNPFGDGEEFRDIILQDLTGWETQTFDMQVNGSLTFSVTQGNVAGQRIGIDSLTVINPNVGEIQLGAELNSEIGYLPTYDLVRGWDQALIRRGRVYYLNPFVEKRYENFLLVSHIHSDGSFMWDIASFDNFRELDKKDSNEAIAIELLANNEILVLKDSSLIALAEDGTTGIPREPVYGIECISRSSVVNINGLILWCGKEDIFLLNIGSSLIPKPLLKDTIRDLYLAIEDKTKIFGVRDRFNTYRIRVDAINEKTEYILTETGWIEERKWHFAEVYRSGFGNKLYFMNEGIIYEQQVDYSQPVSQYGVQTSE